MEVKIVAKTAFTVIGIEGSGDSDKGPEWIPALWEQAFGRLDEVKDLVKSGRGAWGLMSAADEHLAPWKEKGKYLAGWEVERGTKPPKGWKTWDIPEQKFVAIACKIPTYGDAMKYFYEEFSPKEGYEQAGAIHEYYPEGFQDPEKDTIFLYIPVKKK
ncbi:MAG: GyrI-like domain-containing protein [Candidatus Hodarchaeota archaeon]